MSLYYPVTTNQTIIGSKTAAGTRTGVELESTYSTTQDTEPTKVFKVAGMSKLTLNGLYTTGAAETNNTIEVKIESSPDNINFYPISNVDTTSGTSTLYNREFKFTGASAATAYSFEIFLDIAYQYVRVSCKESGVAANKGNVYVEATLAGA
ncbi:hypothetical protein KC850_03520 [Candidatus Kaiserbacteria bacterium]|nr:hypothetical protein [Candidatus Kaiserbacteria bacterium]